MIAHDPSLVILSATIAILGAFTACVMVSGLGTLSRGKGADGSSWHPWRLADLYG